MKKYTVGIAGATGLVGRKMMEVLQESTLFQKNQIKEVHLFASQKSAGQSLPFANQQKTVLALSSQTIQTHLCDFVLMSAGGTVSKEFAPLFANTGAIVIDNSSQWRMCPDVPLVVPEVNAHALFVHKGIIANPNCSTIGAVVALAPLHKKYTIQRIVFTTLQAVSGAGRGGLDDLENNTTHTLLYPIQNNVIPHIDKFLEHSTLLASESYGYTKEEQKLVDETQKILGSPMDITATCIRVPVANAHSESINITFAHPFALQDVFETLKTAKGILLLDDVQNNLYPMPLTANGQDKVLVGRIRRDLSAPNTLNLFVVSDNIRKGAASNAVQILEELAK
ncbi:MAG: aspartate-semialdehyde dehydrogenase [Firmicutes bacterium]|nr:aspartate-semialdehyde dehydrogenase [Bacillota bacterium]